MGQPNYAQFGNRVYAGGADVQVEAGHVHGANDLLMGHGGLESRDEPGGAVSGADPTAQAKTGGCGMSRGKAPGDKGKEQRLAEPDSPTKAKEDQGRRLGSGI